MGRRRNDCSAGRLSDGEAGFDAGLDRGPIQILPDENKLTSSWFVHTPKPVWLGFKSHLHALKNDPFRLPLDAEDSLAPINIPTLLTQKLAQPFLGFFQIQGTFLHKRNGGHAGIMTCSD